MASVNKVIIIGNLGRDPEVRSTQGGTQVAVVGATDDILTVGLQGRLVSLRHVYKPLPVRLHQKSKNTTASGCRARG